ncbi:SAM-dependent methyltransferase [Aurantiacibacter sp. D1-12]|uniref:SAM-dependent methyltransferase n=1 Tax=Aurantiacibacter sp. D1-12 TaxID=2993658 RepID=UPI00237D1699|nr:class I SAM-dependent methyltransferase [Aurantiacibacter sp. D1-12]MDE1467971.1 class I SAM-dependent methyltransferase [Aurantiacibacter sp. D1-12]
MIEDDTPQPLWRRAGKFALAGVFTLALFFAAAWGFDASAVRVFLGLTPELDVPYVATRSAMVDTMLDMAGVGEEDYVIDLGTGDGRILIAAAQDRGARGLGVDLDPALIREATSTAEDLGLETRVQFVEQDLFDTPLSEATVVTMFLLPEVNLRLRPRLLEELAPGSRVVSNRFDMGDWRPDDVRRVGGYNAYAWVVPAQVAGTWRLEVDGRSIPIRLEQQFQRVQGFAAVGGEQLVFSSVLNGTAMRFTLDLGGEQALVFDGTVRGDRVVPDEGGDWSMVRE